MYVAKKLQPPKKDNLSMKDKLPSPKVSPLFRGSNSISNTPRLTLCCIWLEQSYLRDRAGSRSNLFLLREQRQGVIERRAGASGQLDREGGEVGGEEGGDETTCRSIHICQGVKEFRYLAVFYQVELCGEG